MITELELRNVVDPDQLLSRQGLVECKKKYSENPFGTRIGKDREGFIGKIDVLSNIENALDNGGIAILTGGHRTGKSELLLETARALSEKGKIKAHSSVTFYGNADLDIDQEIEDGSDKPLTRRRKGLVTFDEVENIDADRSGDNVVKLVEKAKEFVAEGHKVIITVVGDLDSNVDNTDELSLVSKNHLLTLCTPENVIKNRLLSDDEVREIITSSGKSVFSKDLENYLVAQAGGHPIIAQNSAHIMFGILEGLKKRRMSANSGIIMMFEDRIKETFPTYFDLVEENIVEAGYDPTTWTWNLDATQVSDVDTYRSMLPRQSSTIYYEYLAEKLSKKSRDSWGNLRTVVATREPMVTSNLVEQIVKSDPRRTKKLRTELSPLLANPTALIVEKDSEGFKLWAYNNKEMKPDSMVAVCNRNVISTSKSMPSNDLSAIIESQNTRGIKCVNVKLDTFRGHEKQGLAISLWKLSLLVLANTSEAGLPVVELVTDDSLDVDRKTDWTTRHLTVVKKFMEEMGFTAEELWNGEIDSRRAWAIKYSRKRS